MLKSYDNFIRIAMRSNLSSPEKFLQQKKKISKKLDLPLPTNADLRELYEKMLAEGKIKRSISFEKSLFSKKIRTASGVAVIAVLTKPSTCPGKCIYCPSEKDMPKSYLKNEPAVMRAISAKFNPYTQVQRRIHALELNGHKTDKIELIVMGGTFSYFPKAYQTKFIRECFRAANDYPLKKKMPSASASNLKHEQKRNERAHCRVIGLTLETRPDYIDEKELISFRNLGCTRVELGVQNIFNDILKINRRGHSVEKTIEATRLLKDFGFKINYHIMPGLLGSTAKKDFQMFQKLFSVSDFRPDMLKIYPTVVIKPSALYTLWQKGKYKPLSEKVFEKLVLQVKNEIIPPYVRISRLVRDVPENSIIAGPKISNLRQIISAHSNCQCIRCREVRSTYKKNEQIVLNRIDYAASGGQEIFLEYVSPDKKKLFALLRLRIPSKNKTLAVLSGCALIREVHTYGKLTQIDKQDHSSPQHIGLGKKLIAEAEKIAQQEFDLKKIVVISGVGAREYYKKLGYRLKKTYMIKNI